MDLVRSSTKLRGYTITGYNINTYCKITESAINTPDYKCVLSFGGGMKKFCLVALYDAHKPDEIYIDRVENNDLCVIEGKLHNYEKGTIKLVKIALYVIKYFFPNIKKLTLNDNSQIYCEETSRLFKLSLSYDYIVKYNESWYQKNFKAELPGFISKDYITNSKYPIIKADTDSLMYSYNESLKGLDENIIPYNLILNIFPQFSDYKNEYESSKTPREFINKLRKKLGSQFCFIVGKWLNQYMILLRVKLHPESWYILTSNIEPVPNFKITPLSNGNTKRILDGGRRKTHKNNKNIGYRIISDSNFRENMVGFYDEYLN
jgi:hypothetical protein